MRLHVAHVVSLLYEAKRKKEVDAFGGSTGKNIHLKRCNTSCHGNRVMLALNF